LLKRLKETFETIGTLAGAAVNVHAVVAPVVPPPISAISKILGTQSSEPIVAANVAQLARLSHHREKRRIIDALVAPLERPGLAIRPRARRSTSVS
jgi:hypothetical protein